MDDDEQIDEWLRMQSTVADLERDFQEPPENNGCWKAALFVMAFWVIVMALGYWLIVR